MFRHKGRTELIRDAEKNQISDSGNFHPRPSPRKVIEKMFLPVFSKQTQYRESKGLGAPGEAGQAGLSDSPLSVWSSASLR